MTDFRFHQIDFRQLTPAVGTILHEIRVKAATESEVKLPPAYPRILLLCPSEALMQFLDNNLWIWSRDIFLPHGSAADPHPALQPIFMAWALPSSPPGDAVLPPPNAAKIIMRLDGAGDDEALAQNFTTVLDVFDASSEASKQAARSRFRAAKAASHQVSFMGGGS